MVGISPKWIFLNCRYTYDLYKKGVVPSRRYLKVGFIVGTNGSAPQIADIIRVSDPNRPSIVRKGSRLGGGRPMVRNTSDKMLEVPI